MNSPNANLEGLDMTNNEERTAFVSVALEQYIGRSNDEQVIDCLTDLRHFCDAYGLDFADLDHIAYNHYIEERGE